MSPGAQTCGLSMGFGVLTAQSANCEKQHLRKEQRAKRPPLKSPLSCFSPGEGTVTGGQLGVQRRKHRLWFSMGEMPKTLGPCFDTAVGSNVRAWFSPLELGMSAPVSPASPPTPVSVGEAIQNTPAL